MAAETSFQIAQKLLSLANSVLAMGTHEVHASRLLKFGTESGRKVALLPEVIKYIQGPALKELDPLEREAALLLMGTGQTKRVDDVAVRENLEGLVNDYILAAKKLLNKIPQLKSLPISEWPFTGVGKDEKVTVDDSTAFGLEVHKVYNELLQEVEQQLRTEHLSKLKELELLPDPYTTRYVVDKFGKKSLRPSKDLSKLDEETKSRQVPGKRTLSLTGRPICVLCLRPHIDAIPWIPLSTLDEVDRSKVELNMMKRKMENNPLFHKHVRVEGGARTRVFDLPTVESVHMCPACGSKYKDRKIKEEKEELKLLEGLVNQGLTPGTPEFKDAANKVKQEALEKKSAKYREADIEELDKRQEEGVLAELFMLSDPAGEEKLRTNPDTWMDLPEVHELAKAKGLNKFLKVRESAKSYQETKLLKEQKKEQKKAEELKKQREEEQKATEDESGPDIGDLVKDL